MHPKYSPAFIARFWAKVDKNGPTIRPKLGPCWSWTASTHNAGYGQIGFNKRIAYAHRVAWELCVGPIPDNLLVCHKCDNPPCCNPTHLFLGTDSDNAWDKVRKGRAPRGDQHPNRIHPEHMARGDAHFSRRIPGIMQKKILREEWPMIARLASLGIPKNEIASWYNVTPPAIGYIVKRAKH